MLIVTVPPVLVFVIVVSPVLEAVPFEGTTTTGVSPLPKVTEAVFELGIDILSSLLVNLADSLSRIKVLLVVPEV